MSLFDCLQSAVSAGMMSKPRAQAAANDFAELVARLEASYPNAAAQAIAGQMLKETARRGAQARRHTVLAQLMAAKRNEAIVGRSADPGRSLIELLEGKQGGGTHESVRYVQDALRSQFLAGMREILEAHSLNLRGQVRNRPALRDLLRELHGEASGNPAAKRMADAYRATSERARVLFNAHGGNIGRLDDFGIPHTHETGKVRAAGFEAWRAQVYSRLAWDRIEDAATGRPFAAKGQLPSPAAADRFLRDVYAGIVTEGADELAPSMRAGAGASSLANRHAEARVLHFRSADDWSAYNDRFGTVDPFRAMIGHLERRARDIALLRVLGPAPRAGLDHAAQVARKRLAVEFENAQAAAGTDAAKLAELAKRQQRRERALRSRMSRARAMLAHQTGAAMVPASEAWGRFFAGTRNLLVAAKLGSALLSAPSDIWTARMAAKAVGANPRNVFARQLGAMVGMGREQAAQLGYIADTLANSGNAAARYLGETWGPEWTSTVANGVMRAGLLSRWTDSGRIAFQMEFAALLAREAGKDFGAIEPALRRTLEGRGITAAEWNLIRDPAHTFTAPGGARFITPTYWRESVLGAGAMSRADAEGLAIRWQALVEEQKEFAIPSQLVETRAAILGETQPGTVGGEILRSTLMFKGFALSLTFNQLRRAAAKPTRTSRATYAASLIAGMTVLGALSVQLKSVAQGRDLRDPTDPAFWGQAFWQGGGLGIFGDFITSETSRAGGGLPETVAGPVAGLAGDAIRVGIDATTGGNIGRSAVTFARYNTPGTNLWPTRLAMDRLVWDQLQDLLDPEARDNWRRQEGARVRNFRTKPWWKRGELAPFRGPEMSRE